MLTQFKFIPDAIYIYICEIHFFCGANRGALLTIHIFVFDTLQIHPRYKIYVFDTLQIQHGRNIYKINTFELSTCE